MLIAYALIPARSGSQGLPHKNIRPLGGHPLLAHAVAFGKKLPVERVIVSTDSPEYRDIALSYGAECPVLRADEASTSAAREEDILADLAHTLPVAGIEMPDVWVWLKPTSPLRRVLPVKLALACLEERADIDSVRIVSEADARLQVQNGTGWLEPMSDLWPSHLSKVPRTAFPRAFKPFNLEVFRHSGWERWGAGFMGRHIEPIVEPKVTGLDIDDIEDFQIVEALVDARPDWLGEFVHI